MIRLTFTSVRQKAAVALSVSGQPDEELKLMRFVTVKL
jgi:hypothetical protein